MGSTSATSYWPWRGGWSPGFKSESHRARFIAAGLRNITPLSAQPQCTAIARTTGQRCRCACRKNRPYCLRHDRTWRPKDPNTPRRLRAKAIGAAKRYNARVYAAVDAELAKLPPLPPNEYDALRRAMVVPQLWWVPPLDEWIRQGMPWPPQAPDTKGSPTENQGQS